MKRKLAEIAGRFVYGGLVTVATWLVGKKMGPGMGGLFLAFPAILPATLTLVKSREGREKAADEGLGAVFGSVGLIAFAIVTWSLAARGAPVLTLVAAGLAWLAASVATWWLVIGRK